MKTAAVCFQSYSTLVKVEYLQRVFDLPVLPSHSSAFHAKQADSSQLYNLAGIKAG